MSDYEQSDANPTRLLWCGAGLGMLVLLAALVMGWLHQSWRTGPPPTVPGPPEPVVKRDPDELHRYRWVDRAQGLVQIPIEEAMQVVSQGGSGASHSVAVPDVRSAAGRAGAPLRATPGSSGSGREPDR